MSRAWLAALVLLAAGCVVVPDTPGVPGAAGPGGVLGPPATGDAAGPGARASAGPGPAAPGRPPAPSRPGRSSAPTGPHDPTVAEPAEGRAPFVVRPGTAFRLENLAGAIGDCPEWCDVDGPYETAEFDWIEDMAVADDGALFVLTNTTVRKLQGGEVTRVIGAPNHDYFYAPGRSGRAFEFNDTPTALALGPGGDLYVADQNLIHRVTQDGQAAVHLGEEKTFHSGFGGHRFMAFGPDGRLYVDATGPEDPTAVVAIDADGRIAPVAGNYDGDDAAGPDDGPGREARFRSAGYFAYDAIGGAIYFTEELGGYRVRKIDLTDPAYPVTTIAGSGEKVVRDGAGTEAAFFRPAMIALDRGGSLFVVDLAEEAGPGRFETWAVRRIDLGDPSHPVTTLEIEGAGDERSFHPNGLAIARDGTVIVANRGVTTPWLTMLR